VQVLFPGARILPLVVGAEDPALPERLGRALASLARGRNALVVASSDLSRYPSARDAAMVDRRVLEAIASLDPERLRATLRAEEARGVPGLGTCACGEAPILTAMAAARALGAARGTVVRYATSADVPAGDPARVVGYGAVAFEAGPVAGRAAPAGARTAREHAGTPPPPRGEAGSAGRDSIDGPARTALLAHARDAIARHLSGAAPPSGAGLPPAASLPRGAFVTLKKAGELRGCIGRLEPDAPLGATVAGMAVAAAVRDPRFPPVTREELDQLTIEISVLTPARPVPGPQEVIPGRDGVLLAKAGRRAVFLPQVASEQGWGRDELLDHLCLKAGLPAGCWQEGAALQTFQAEVFGEAHRP
jgi:AmmeMemoRadiSam system protein A